MSGVSSAKPYDIAKRTVWDAYQQVRANRGAAGIDDETIADFERDLSKNLYKLWNRMSSGSYFPPPVKQVEIPKASGGTRKLGVPTVGDRVAQTVVKLLIEPELDSIFHSDSYGYRPGRSAKQAVAITRERCWRYDWVVEFDIKAAFDQINHGLLMKAVRLHIKEDWILLYIERWLVAPFETDDGMRVPRERGTPQGGVLSPLLMNLFMHYAFDTWMQRTSPNCPFARYADDAVVHCRSRKQAEYVMRSIASRLAACGLTMHPEKSKVVYVIQGWWQYYGSFYRTAMLGIFQHIDRALERWARRKYKALHRRKRRISQWLDKMRTVVPRLFHHWRVTGQQGWITGAV
ncbi:group II intron reverse transcriptase/maturase [Pseudomonas aeruginosa]|uniref:group II intron reverse transcriptase/maturase n=1 Tax=Pseudomonas aeruginosa TaxID=287 RepID=UPI0010680E56|nr:group II intron reverse transcriptase/maturase [Pseudomonas aeruginosa]TED53903.1 group II intron reverse transcriptase/maturase [Pseudomonas aeruginosa]